MATFTQIRKSTAKAIQHGHDGRGVMAFHYAAVQDVQESPAIVVAPADRIAAEFGKAMQRGLDEWYLNVIVMVAANVTLEMAQEELDEFVSGMGDKSIRSILEDDHTVGLPDTFLTVTGVRDYGGMYKVGDVRYVGAIITVTARTSGK